MPTLFLLRHGKSDWGADFSGDHERPLKKRGVKASKRMGDLLTSAGDTPDVVLTSSALRARTTAELAHEAGGWTCAIHVEGGLYDTTPNELLEHVRRLGEGERVLVVNHEPTCSSTVSVLCGGAAPVFPTAALARIDLNVDRWKDVEPGCGELAWLVTPRLIGAVG
jgi:phosphohistidine phosphatase